MFTYKWAVVSRRNESKITVDSIGETAAQSKKLARRMLKGSGFSTGSFTLLHASVILPTSAPSIDEEAMINLTSSPEEESTSFEDYRESSL